MGIFVHQELPGELRLVQGQTVTQDNLSSPEFVEFFETLGSHIAPQKQGGHVDIFTPLGTSGNTWCCFRPI